jgi:hypothetical protein
MTDRIVVAARLEPDVVARIDALAQRDGLRRSDVVRDAVVEHLERAAAGSPS